MCNPFFRTTSRINGSIRHVYGSWVSLRAFITLDATRTASACSTRVSSGAAITCCALGPLRSGCAILAGITLITLGSLSARNALRTLLAGIASRTLWPLRPLQPALALWPLRPLFASGAGGSLFAPVALVAFWSGRPLFTLRTFRASLARNTLRPLGSVLARIALRPLLALEALGTFGSGRSRYGNGREGGGDAVQGSVHYENAVENRLQVDFFAFRLRFALLLRRFFAGFFRCFRSCLRLRRHALSPFRTGSKDRAG